MESELTFVAPEGVYSVTEEHKPTTLNPHIVITTPSLYPTRVSTALVRFPASSKQTGGIGSPGLAHLLGGGKSIGRDKDKEKGDAGKPLVGDDGKSLSSSDNAGTDDDLNGSGSGQDVGIAASPQNNSPLHAQPLQASEQPNLFSQPAQISGKKKSVSRPKHNIRTTTSTFVTRLQAMEGLTKVLQGKTGEVTFMFYNQGKNFFWTELGTKPKVRMLSSQCIYFVDESRVQEPLARITFAAYPTCHSVNASTASSERLDVVIGFNTGDLIWFGMHMHSPLINCTELRLHRSHLWTLCSTEQAG